MNRVHALLLAAGLSRRTPEHKLLLKIGDRTVLEKALANLLSSQVDGVTVVVGHRASEIRKIVSGYGVKVVENPDYEQGMGTSVAAGVRTLIGHHHPDGIMIALGDMPGVMPVTIDILLAEFKQQRPLITIPVYLGRKGHPVIFDYGLAEELAELGGDVGARSVIARHEQGVRTVSVIDAGILWDVDTPDDLDNCKMG